MKFTRFLPFEKYTLSTKLSVEEVRNRIANKIEPKKRFRFSLAGNSHYKPYEGTLTGNSFTISRIISYRNSFLPEVTGHISNIGAQTHIAISMQPAILVLIFIAAWLIFAGFGCITMLLFTIFQFKKLGFSPAALAPFALFIFGWLLSYFAFKKESKSSKEFLAGLFEATEITT